MSVDLADLELEEQGVVLVASIAGEVDMSNAPDIRNAIVRALSNQALGLVLDVSRVSYLDSAAIHVMYELRELLANRGQRLRLVIPPESPSLHALSIAGVPAAIPVDATVSDARAGVERGGGA